MSVRLYIGNLPKELDRQELADVFAEAGDSVSTKVITDRKTGKCRGFGFVTVNTDEEADQIIAKFDGYEFKDAILKIEKALPRAKGKEDGAVDLSQETESGGSGKSSRRKGSNNKARKSSGSSTSDSTSVQPDPRWAQDLEKLKEMLAAQTAGS